jgi:predicted ATPase/DNA-binding SARP family transcriptional activator
VEFRILGPLEVVDERPLAVGPPKQRALLAVLLRARGTVARDRLIASLWGDEPPKRAQGSLQVYVHGLRQALGADRIETSGTAYRLRIDATDRVDADELARLVRRARTALDRARADEAAADLESALALWRGAALADIAEVGELGAFADELEELRFEALELRNDAWLDLGRHKLVLRDIERLVAAQPYREQLRIHHITALYRDGRQAEALAAYRALRETWSDELGIEPTPALRELERAVLRHDGSLDDPAVAPPQQSLRLPAPPTPLVGRRLEIASIAALLRSETRLVTLVGPGGTGKTRLALAVAEELGPELRDGAVFVDLSAVADQRLLVPAIAQALGLSEDADLGKELATRGHLLVLDNFEQIVEGAKEVAALLAAARSLRVLATSRTPLRLAAEHEYPVQPLPVPRVDATAGELAQNEAVQLFVARAAAAGRALEPDAGVAALCRRLDGLPLALELAAARTKLLSPAEILVHIDRDPALLASQARDVPARHATLAATIHWSLGLLDERERRAFARLGVFAGGCTLDGAAQIGIDPGSLGSIVDMSLLQRRDGNGRPRFAMLETVRPFALELLEATGGDGVRRRHAESLAELAEKLQGEDTAAGLDELEAELENIRAALAWAAASDVDLALRLMLATRTFWEVRGHLRESARWLDDILSVAGDMRPELRAPALGFAGTAAFRGGDVDRAEARWREMLSVFEQLGDREGIARGLSDVGTAAAARGEWERSRELLERAAALFRELGNAGRLAVAVANLGHVAAHEGDFPSAAAFTLEALELERERGDDMRAAISLNNLASIACEAGDNDDARAWLDECLELAHRIGYREVVAHALVTRARLALNEGDPLDAARAAAAADAAFAEAGAEMAGVEGERFAALKDAIRSSLGAEEYERAYAEAATRTAAGAAVDARTRSVGR